jgi:hypothetical protein
MASGDSRAYVDLFSGMVVPFVSAVAIIWLFLRAIRQGVRNVRVVEDVPEKK